MGDARDRGLGCRHRGHDPRRGHRGRHGREPRGRRAPGVSPRRLSARYARVAYMRIIRLAAIGFVGRSSAAGSGARRRGDPRGTLPPRVPGRHPRPRAAIRPAAHGRRAATGAGALPTADIRTSQPSERTGMWDIVNFIATGLIVAFAIAITHRVVAGRRLRRRDRRGLAARPRPPASRSGPSAPGRAERPRPPTRRVARRERARNVQRDRHEKCRGESASAEQRRSLPA